MGGPIDFLRGWGWLDQLTFEGGRVEDLVTTRIFYSTDKQGRHFYQSKRGA